MDKPGGTSWTGDLWGGLAAMLVALPSAIAFGVTIFSPLGAGNVAQGALAGILGATVLGLVAPAFGGTDRLITAPCAPAAAVLVATTVIEVGVDVPNASLMVIEHAERFGLAQLHQLRGRVGRGVHESVCILLFAQPLSQTGRERLKAIYEHTDGFVIAREDLRIRGPGEFIGARQSGVPLLRYADLEADATLVDVARGLAEEILRDAPRVADAITARWFGGRANLLKA